MRNPERWLKIVMLLFAMPAAFAVFPFLMPFGWMAAIHQWIGMGDLPNRPIVDYLARYASGFCAFYGFLLLLLITDVRRYERIITFQAIAIIVLSTAGSIFAWRSGIPRWWILADLISCWGYCGGMLWLQSKMRQADQAGVEKGASPAVAADMRPQ